MDAVQTHDLTRRFGQRVAVDRLTLSIPEGTVFGFLGPNGAGKTTTVRMLAALIAPTAGSAQVAGYELGVHNTAIRRSTGILTETPGMYPTLTAMQNLMFFGGLYGLDAQRARQQATRYLTMFELWDRRDDRVGTFSKGMRQKLALARALLHEPRILFLDEPTAGLDPASARTVRDAIRQLKAEGRTIFLTTHNLNEADELCDLIGVFRTRLLSLGSPAQLRATLFGKGVVIHVAGEAQPWAYLVRSLSFVREVSVQDSRLSIRLDDPDNQNPVLVRTLVQAGAQIRYITPLTHSLEDVYLQLVEEEGS